MGLSFKVKLCYVNFILLLATGVLTYVSGFILWLVLPRGQDHGRFAARESFLGISRGLWEDVHIVSSLLLLALVVIHLVLNWAWIKNVTKCIFSYSKTKSTKPDVYKL